MTEERGTEAQLTTIIEGYPVTVEYDKEGTDITRCYIGFNSGLNVWPILSDEFKLKVFDCIIDFAS